MKEIDLTRVINRGIYVTHASRQQREESRTAQSCSYCSAPARLSTRCSETTHPSLLHLPTSSLPLPRDGEETETLSSGRRRQSLIHRQALTESGQHNPHLCRFDRIDLERDCKPRIAGAAESRGRSWTITCRVPNGGCGWSINLIGCWQKSWSKLMRCLSQTRSDRLPANQQVLRRV